MLTAGLTPSSTGRVDLVGARMGHEFPPHVAVAEESVSVHSWTLTSRLTQTGTRAPIAAKVFACGPSPDHCPGRSWWTWGRSGGHPSLWPSMRAAHIGPRGPPCRRGHCRPASSDRPRPRLGLLTGARQRCYSTASHVPYNDDFTLPGSSGRFVQRANRPALSRSGADGSASAWGGGPLTDQSCDVDRSPSPWSVDVESPAARGRVPGLEARICRSQGAPECVHPPRLGSGSMQWTLRCVRHRALTSPGARTEVQPGAASGHVTERLAAAYNRVGGSTLAATPRVRATSPVSGWAGQAQR